MKNIIFKILFLSIFLISGFSKLFDFHAFTESLYEMDFRQPAIFAALIILFQIGGSVLVILSNNDMGTTLTDDGKIVPKETINIKKNYGKFGIIMLMIYLIFNAYYFDYGDRVKLIQGVSSLGGLFILYQLYLDKKK